MYRSTLSVIVTNNPDGTIKIKQPQPGNNHQPEINLSVDQIPLFIDWLREAERDVVNARPD